LTGPAEEVDVRGADASGVERGGHGLATDLAHLGDDDFGGRPLADQEGAGQPRGQRVAEGASCQSRRQTGHSRNNDLRWVRFLAISGPAAASVAACAT
jgi:hypothetical protein